MDVAPAEAPVAPAIEPAGFFVLRTPLAPFHDFGDWSDGLQAPNAVDAALAKALAADRSLLRARLAAYLDKPEIREALFVATPSLDESIAVWRERPDSERGRRVERTLVRYVARLAGRATPFGLFAGCSVGRIGAETRLQIAGRGEYRRHTRLDTDYLFTLVDAVARNPAVRAALTYRPNSSLYRVADRLRYVESRLAGTLRSYHLVAVQPSEALETALARAHGGAGFEALVAALAGDDVSTDEAAAFVGELVESQVLVPELRVPVTGPEPTEVLASDLAGRPETASVARPLEEARRAMQDLDAAGLGNPVERYRAIARSLEPLPARVEVSRLFQVDMTKPAPEAVLGAAVLDEIAAGAELLRRLAPPRREDGLKRFREAFRDRYEEREVPLVEALDEEAGIGFEGSLDTSPLLEGMPLATAADREVPWGAREVWLLRKLNEALADGRPAIELDGQDVERLAVADAAPLPRAFAVLATVAAAGDQALASGDFRVFLECLDGPSGARLLGRFCHADDTLSQLVAAHLRAEEACDPSAVFTEIVHLPEGRSGNILLRPVLREYEIDYLGRSGAAAERQIPVTDLMVSVKGREVVLRSTRLQRRVIPRLTSAHNFTMARLGLYRFLCALQAQAVTAARCRWDWGALSHAPFLPRVVFGKLVLSRAAWRVHKDELERLGRGDALARFREVQAWRAARRLPRRVLLVDGDNTLPVDLANALAVESLVHLLKGREEARFEELFPGPDQLCARGPEGRFVHELVVPFVRAPGREDNLALEAGMSRRRLASARSAAVRRSLPPGSEWLYVKLYCGTSTADQVLRELVGPVVRKTMYAGHADRWFFIRYADPELHLRLRFHGSAPTLQQAIWPALRDAAAPFLEDRRIWRLALDTYEREIERYGGPDGVEVAEELFHADSEAVLSIVERLDPGVAGLDERWRLAFCGMHGLLEDLQIDLAARASLLHAAAQAWVKELRWDPGTDHWLGQRFRNERPGLVALLDPTLPGRAALAPGLLALRRRSKRWRHAAARLSALEAAGRLWAPRQEIAKSYLHMHVNRLLRSAQVRQEVVLSEFLARHYESEIARRRAGRTAEAVALAR
jgi:thiopeptide-type bacteriocin biosynthesis protein